MTKKKNTNFTLQGKQVTQNSKPRKYQRNTCQTRPAADREKKHSLNNCHALESVQLSRAVSMGFLANHIQISC